MTELMRFDLTGGGSVLVEVDDDERGVVRAARTRGAVESAATSLSVALTGVRDAAAEALRQFREMATAPDEVQLEFGVRLNAEAGAVIAKTSAEGHLTVTLTWSRTDRQGRTV